MPRVAVPERCCQRDHGARAQIRERGGVGTHLHCFGCAKIRVWLQLPAGVRRRCRRDPRCWLGTDVVR